MKVTVTFPGGWSDEQIDVACDVFLDQTVVLASALAALGFPNTVSIDVEL